MRYFVLVNGRFMVKVDNHSSLDGAEHEILDNINGAQTALAFDEDDIKGEYFRTLLLKEETVLVDSVFDLDAIFYKLHSAYGYIETSEQQIKDLRGISDDLQKKIFDLDRCMIHAEERLEDAKRNLENVKAELGIVDGR